MAGNHWEEVFWHLLARNFGMPVNADSFESIAATIPVQVLASHKNRIQQLEALLLGQAGLLEEEFLDDYPLMLQREYQVYCQQIQFEESPIAPVFLRMRPANFPTVRLAQLAMLISLSEHLFSKIKDAKAYTEVCELLNVTANDFWHYHYQLNMAADFKPKLWESK